MGHRKHEGTSGSTPGASAHNAQHGQNRTGVEVESGVTFEEFESKVPINPQAADDRIADEGPEIQARVHALGHDVLGEVEEDEKPPARTPSRPSGRTPGRRRAP